MAHLNCPGRYFLHTCNMHPYLVINRLYMCRNISDEPIDSESGGIPKYLGQIADFMYEWEGPIANELGLTSADIASIKTKYSDQLRLQT